MTKTDTPSLWQVNEPVGSIMTVLLYQLVHKGVIRATISCNDTNLLLTSAQKRMLITCSKIGKNFPGAYLLKRNRVDPLKKKEDCYGQY